MNVAQPGCDVAIVGGGPVGTALALALQDSGLRVTVLEARPDAQVSDARAIALSYGSRLMLERLGVWAELQARATPITTIHVSQSGQFGRTLLSAAELDVPALGYTVEYGHLYRALADVASAARLDIRYGAPVSAARVGEVRYGEAGCEVALAAQLVVLAEGGKGLPVPTVREKDYGQSAVVCTVKTMRPHGNRAYERFTPHGPIALLPLGEQFALVWTTPTDAVASRLALDDAAFLDQLYTAFGARQGPFVAAGPRAAFPLRMALRGAGDQAGLLRIGNAAQLLHPVAGQGFNLGLRDAWQLAETILDTPADVLMTADLRDRYVKARGWDAQGGARTTDVLVELFAHEPPVVSGLRGLGLTMLDLLPAAKAVFARKMMHGVRTW